MRPSSTTVRQPRVLARLAIMAVLVLVPLVVQATMVTGTYTGNGAGARTVGGLGFTPVVVVIKADGDDSAVIRTSTMPAFYSRHLVEEWGLLTNRIHGFTADGFSVGSDPDVNHFGRVYHYVAFSADDGYLALGTYTGDGNNVQVIDDVGFSPATVLLLPHGTAPCRFKSSTMPGMHSVPLGEDAEDDDTLVALLGEGFRVGSSAEANGDGEVYSYVAFAPSGNSVYTGSYTGDGADDRLLGGVGFTPSWLITKQFGSKGGAHLTSGLSGEDRTLAFTPHWPFGGGILELTGDGFRIGGHERVNEWDQEYHVVAFASREAAADVAVDVVVDEAAPELGDLVSLTATISNAGPATATGAQLAVDLPAGLALQSYTADAGAVSDTSSAAAIRVTWNIPAGESRQVQATYLIEQGPASRDIVGAATAIPPDPDAANDLETVTLAVPTVDLAVAMLSSDSSPVAGDTITLDVEVTNPSASLDADVVADFVIPDGMSASATFLSHGSYDPGTDRWTIGVLPAGVAATLALESVIGADQDGNVLTPTVTVTGSRNDDDLADNTAAIAHAIGGGADLAAGLAWSPASAGPGDAVQLVASVVNHGPDALPSFTGTLALPGEVTVTGTSVDGGVFDDGTGVWTGPAVAVGDSVALAVEATVAGVDAGVASATFTAVSPETDPVPGNDTASDDLALDGAYDLWPGVTWTPMVATSGDTVSLAIVMVNDGPGAAPGLDVVVSLPSALSITGAAATTGGFDADGGAWTSSAPFAAAASETLTIVGVTAPDASGTVTASAEVVAGPGETDLANDTASAALELARVTDLATSLDFQDASAGAGDDVVLVAEVRNLGPSSSGSFTTTISLPDALDLRASAASMGTYDDGAGTWTVDQTLASGEVATLSLLTGVTSVESGTVAATASTAAGDTDPVAANDTATADLELIGAPDVSVAIVPFAETERTLLPGGPPVDVLRLRLHNRGGRAAELDTITVRNVLTGAYDQTTQDGYWRALTLTARGGVDVDLGEFSGGTATATGLGIAVAAGDSLDVAVRGAAAVTVPDGVPLAVRIDGAADLGLVEGEVASASWPLAAAGELAVDGMGSAQIQLHPIGAEIFQMGSARNLALDVTIPANGTEPDTMIKLNVVNRGSATAGDVLTRVEAWTDDGDGVYDAAADDLVAELHWTGGQRFEATALAVPIPAEGRRVFVTVDIAADALGGTVQLSLPAGDDPAIGMLSGNDGPLDAAVINPFVQTVSATDRVILTASAIGSRTVTPGESAVPLLALVGRNLHAGERVLERLRLRNVSVGVGDPPQAVLDRITGPLRLHRDGDADGLFDGAPTDPVVASTTWEDGVATFDGVDWSLPPDEVTALFVSTEVALLDAAEGDSIGAAIGSGSDLVFDQDVALVAAWPLDSGARHAVDGLVAAQLVQSPVPPVSLTASEGPVVAFAVTVPGNGHRGDTLEDVRLENLGSAGPGDIAELALWTDDDDDGLFEPGTDTQVAVLSGIDASWVGLDLGLAIPPGGQRLFAGLTVTDTPADSSTVQLSVPVDGLEMASAHDGPIDAAVQSPTSLLISTAPLLSTMEIAAGRSTTEMTVTVQMHVTNVGSETVNGIAPGDLALVGQGALDLVAGPQPATFDLDDGESGTFTWT
ncbi:DUF11 domain-containing protein, partial [bacterium]|nr:DUF11 domain-containing protein [bacterium]